MKNFKKVISAVIALALSASTLVSAASFTDVAKTAPYAEAVEVLSSLGIVNGYEDGTFRPEGQITRAEAATMIVGALNMTADAQNAAGTSIFADVNEQAAWAAGYINVGVSQKFISGMGDGTFAPQANVTYAQMCVMLTSIAGYGEYAANGGYPKGYTDMAASTGINKGIAAADETPLTRGQVAQMIYNTLVTPMLGVAEYNLTGNTYSQLDGKNNRDFKTLLSDKWDGYVATVNINKTPLSDSIENDEVGFAIKKADWWYDGYAITDLNAGSYASEIELFDGVDVNANLFQTGRAIFVLNEDDDIVMKYFGATGKTRTEEFDAADYVLQSELSDQNQYHNGNASDPDGALAANEKIRFGSKYYKIESGFDIYVNGILATDGTNLAPATDIDGNASLTSVQTILDKYLGNAIGTVTLLDDGTTTGYETIMVDIWNVAKVAAVEYENSKTVVTMTTKNALAGRQAYEEIVIDDENVEEGKTVVSVEKNGQAAELTSLVKGDIIAYKSDIFDADVSLDNPKSLEILATDDTVVGKVTGKDTEEKTFTVDGTAYEAVVYNSSLVAMGENYTLTLDPFGRIYAAEQTGSADLYAIATTVTTDGYVKLVLADGSQKSYALESGAVKNTANKLTSASEAELRTYLAQDSVKALDRIVKYKVRNSTGEIMSIDIINSASIVNNWSTADEYKSRTSRLGSAEITAETVIIDARKAAVEPTAGSNYAKFDAANLKDGVDYKFVAVKTNTFTNLVVLAAVGTKISDDSRFAIVTKGPQADVTDDGDDVEIVEVLYKGEKTTLTFNEGVYADFKHDGNTTTTDTLHIGDAFYFDVDSYGYVNDVFVIYNSTSKFINLTTALGNSGKTASDYVATSGEDAWNYTLSNTGSNANADVQLAAGYVIPGADGMLTLAEIVSPLVEIDTNKDHKTTGDKGVAIFAVTDDTELYLYDTNADVIKEGDKLSVKADASVLASASLSKYEDNGVYKPTNNGIQGVTDMTSDANYAVALIVDEVVVSVYVIK